MSGRIDEDLSVGSLGLLLDRWKVRLEVRDLAVQGRAEVVLSGFGPDQTPAYRTTTGPVGVSSGTILVLALKDWRDNVRGGRP